MYFHVHTTSHLHFVFRLFIVLSENRIKLEMDPINSLHDDLCFCGDIEC